MRTSILGWSGLLLVLAGCTEDPVPMAPGAMLTGQAFYRERIAAPPGARFEVVLEEVSGPDAPSRIGTFARIDAGQPPYAFELHYDAERVVEARRYALGARLTHEGQVLFATERPFPVITDGAPTTGIDLLLRRPGDDRAQEAGGADAALEETYWKLTRLGEDVAEVHPDQREAHLVFHRSENRLSGSDGCNLLSGRWRSDGATLELDPGASTMMACPAGEAQARRFRLMLRSTARFRIAGEQLELLDAAGDLIARFEAVALT